MRKVFYRNRTNGREHSCSEQKWEALAKSSIGHLFEKVSTQDISLPEPIPVENETKEDAGKEEVKTEPAKPAKRRRKKD